MMNHNNSKYVNPPTTKIQLISLNYIQTQKEKRKKSLILIQREKQNKRLNVN